MKWKKRMKAWINCSLISIPFHYHFVLIKTKKRAFITFFVLIITKCTTLRTESMKMKERINTKKRNGCVINSFTSFFILSPSPGCVEWIVNEVERSMRSLCSLIFFVLLHLHFIPMSACLLPTSLNPPISSRCLIVPSGWPCDSCKCNEQSEWNESKEKGKWSARFLSFHSLYPLCLICLFLLLRLCFIHAVTSLTCNKDKREGKGKANKGQP